MFQVNNIIDALAVVLFIGGIITIGKVVLSRFRKKKPIDTSTFLTDPLSFDEATVLLASITLTARFQTASFAQREELLRIYAERLRGLLEYDPTTVVPFNKELNDLIKRTTTEV